MSGGPALLHIVGRPGAGKTRLIEALVPLLALRGCRTVVVRLRGDRSCSALAGSEPGRYRAAGATGAALLTEGGTEVFLPPASPVESVARLRHVFGDCHLILCEGDGLPGSDMIEVVPPGQQPLFAGNPGLRAIVGADGDGTQVACFSCDDAAGVCNFILEGWVSGRVSAAVLAGGMSSRLGFNKALLPVGSETIIDRILGTVSPLVAGVRIISNSPQDYAWLGLPTASDLRPGCGPLSGIHAALATAETPYVLVLSCDIPLISRPLLRHLIESCAGADITIFKHRYFEPLCAVYRRTCLPALDEQIDNREPHIIDLFAPLQVRVLHTADGTPFRNVNTKKDYHDMLELLKADSGTDNSADV